MTQAKNIYNCQNCGKEYSTENQTNFKSKKFCCKECLEKYNENNPDCQVLVYVCEYCGAEFTKNKNSTAKCCCKSCTSKLNFIIHPELKEKVHFAIVLSKRPEAIEKNRQSLKKHFKIKKEEKLSQIQPYNCETCEKLVEPENYYGGGRFCCPKCARSFSSKYANTNEKRKEKSITQKTKEKVLKYCKKCGCEVYVYPVVSNVVCNECKNIKEIHIKQIKKQFNNPYNEIHKKIYDKIMEYYNTYNFADIRKILNISEDIFSSVVKKYNITPNSIFIPSTHHAKIKFCKLVLNKETSITNDDFNKVKEILEYHYYTNNMSSKEIQKLYNYDYSDFSVFLHKVFGLKMRTFKETSILYNKKIGTYDNKTEKELYYANCRFRFGILDYPQIPGYDLIKTYGIYNPVNNLNGVSRDHMISINYGWKNNISPDIISHPANCEIIQQNLNSSKGANISISLDELKKRIVEWGKSNDSN